MSKKHIGSEKLFQLPCPYIKGAEVYVLTIKLEVFKGKPLAR
jgi:hypothetical protein